MCFEPFRITQFDHLTLQWAYLIHYKEFWSETNFIGLLTSRAFQRHLTRLNRSHEQKVMAKWSWNRAIWRQNRAILPHNRAIMHCNRPIMRQIGRLHCIFHLFASRMYCIISSAMKSTDYVHNRAIMVHNRAIKTHNRPIMPIIGRFTPIFPILRLYGLCDEANGSLCATTP